jgi:ribose 5-phosphate isomerase B
LNGFFNVYYFPVIQATVFNTINMTLSSKYRIAIGTDHAAFDLRNVIKKQLEAAGHSVLDFGTNAPEACDYPDYVRPAAQAVADGRADFGIVLGGSGNGEAIVANKVTGVRCGLCWDLWSAEMTRAHNNANVLSMGSRVVDQATALQIVDVFLKTPFEGGRHSRRVDKIEMPQ